MKTIDQIEQVLNKIDTSNSKYLGMSYEQGIEEALMWVLGELEDAEFTPLTDNA